MSNMRSIVWLLVGIALLAAANMMLSLDEPAKSAIIMPRSGLLPMPDGKVTSLEILREGRKEAVIRNAGGWRIVEPFEGTVDESAVLRVIDALSNAHIDDMLGDQELLKLGRTRTDFALSPPRLEYRVSAGDRETSVSFGSATPSGAGVYAAVEGTSAVFVVPSNTLSRVDVPTSDFRLRALFTSGEDSVAAFDVKRGSGEFMRFRRDGDGWVMVRPTEGPASVTRVKKLLSDVMSARAVDFVWPSGGTNEASEASAALLSGYGLDPESAVTLTIKGTDGSDRRISFGTEARAGLVYALIHNGAEVVTVSNALKDCAMAGSAAFSDTRIFPYEPTQVSALTLVEKGRDVTCLLAKREDGSWHMDSPVVAAASLPAVEALVSAVLALKGADSYDGDDGIEVSVPPDERKVRVARMSLGQGFRLENLRSLEILKVDPKSVRRLSVTGTDTNGVKSVVYDRDRSAWNVETSSVKGTVSESAVARVLGVLNPLSAGRIVQLKVSADDLGGYGLDKPRLTVAIDLDREDAIRRNILVGDSADGGYFATVGASDAVFVIPESAVDDLSAEIIGE